MPAALYKKRDKREARQHGDDYFSLCDACWPRFSGDAISSLFFHTLPRRQLRHAELLSPLDAMLRFRLTPLRCRYADDFLRVIRRRFSDYSLPDAAVLSPPLLSFDTLFFFFFAIFSSLMPLFFALFFADVLFAIVAFASAMILRRFSIMMRRRACRQRCCLIFALFSPFTLMLFILIEPDRRGGFAHLWLIAAIADACLTRARLRAID